MTIIRVILFAIFFSLSSCISFDYDEPEAKGDATPPPGYSPYFLSRIIPLPPTPPPTTTIPRPRIDVRDPKKVKVYFHIMDSTGTHFTGGTSAQWKKLLCKAVTKIGSHATEITKFTVTERVESDRKPVAIVLVTDLSGSMGHARALAVQSAAEHVIGRMSAEDGLALVNYDHRVSVDIPFTTDKILLHSSLVKDGLARYGGGTAIVDGIGVAIDHLVGQAGNYDQRAIIVLTDGRENSSKQNRDSVVARALQNNIIVCGVDFGKGVAEGYMESIARSTGGSHAHIYLTSEFPAAFEDVYKRLKNYYLLEFPAEAYGRQELSLVLCWGKDSLRASFEFDNMPDIGAIALLNVHFDFGKSTIKSESRPAINNIVALMRAYPTMTIEIRGHTDSLNRTNDPNFNRTLSQSRADAVRDAIVKMGVDASRVTSRGFGDSVPIASNTTDDGRALNRRTEFIILNK